MAEIKEQPSAVSLAMEKVQVQIKTERPNLQLLKVEPHGRSYSPGYPVGARRSTFRPLKIEADILTNPKAKAVDVDGSPLKDADGKQLTNADLIYYHHNTGDCGTEPIGEGESFEIVEGSAGGFDIESIFAGPTDEPVAPEKPTEPVAPIKQPAKVGESK